MREKRALMWLLLSASLAHSVGMGRCFVSEAPEKSHFSSFDSVMTGSRMILLLLDCWHVQHDIATAMPFA